MYGKSTCENLPQEADGSAILCAAWPYRETSCKDLRNQMNSRILSVFPSTAAVNRHGHLLIGGCDTVELAQQFGTPLYVFDVATLREQCRAHVAAFAVRYADTCIYYAAKAWLSVKLAQFMRDEGLGLDVVSAGEMYVARAAGFPAQRVCLHGNNKSADELVTALEWGVGRIVVDNLNELDTLVDLATHKQAVAPVLLRIAPSVDPHTHRYIATGVADSKFGLPMATGMAEQAVQHALAASSVKLYGYHVHIGSQIHDLDAYRRTVGLLVTFAAQMRQRYNYTPVEISMGGGWAVRYLPDDEVPTPDDVADVLTKTLQAACREYAMPLPTLSIEPGRALVARAGVALYTVGASKDIAGIRRYIFIDGGMADNIRPALYGARYAALIANRVSTPASERVTIAGRYCESADVLITDAMLPPPQRGDILAVATCGAYAPSMWSNYNMALRPAIVVVADGQATLWRRRETYEDLLRCDVFRCDV